VPAGGAPGRPSAKVTNLARGGRIPLRLSAVFPERRPSMSGMERRIVNTVEESMQ